MYKLDAWIMRVLCEEMLFRSFVNVIDQIRDVIILEICSLASHFFKFCSQSFSAADRHRVTNTQSDRCLALTA
jgi:hypothetical protein